MDINGAKAPNKFGKDVFDIRVHADSVKLGNWTASCSKAMNDILINKT